VIAGGHPHLVAQYLRRRHMSDRLLGLEAWALQR
jgi:hypothetical protein